MVIIITATQNQPLLHRESLEFICTCGREGTAGLEVGKARVGASGVSGFCNVSAGGGVTFGFSCASMTSNAAGKGQKA